MADVLSNYYKKLHKLHDISADAFEISDQESEGESEGIPATPHAREVGSLVRLHVIGVRTDEMALEGLSYEEWQMKRIKDEVKSFMKQLITEVLSLRIEPSWLSLSLSSPPHVLNAV